MRLTDELKEARTKVERAMYEQSLRDEVRCAGAGARYGLDIPQKGDQGRAEDDRK